MEDIQRLADAIDLARLRAARAASPIEKLLASPRLFDRVRDVISACRRRKTYS